MAIAPLNIVLAQPKSQLETLCYPVGGKEDESIADKKIAACSELLLKSPENAELYFYRSTAHMFKNDYRAAVTDLTKAINLKSSRADFYRGLRLKLYDERLNDPQSALADADYLISVSNSKEGEIHFRTVRTEILFGIARHLDAEKDVLRILELDSQNSYAQIMLKAIELHKKQKR